MIERMKNVLKNRKDEGDKGFSLVELAVVIVIIGILVAIAIPVFSGIQDGARKSAIEAAAANGSAIAASEIASVTNGKLTSTAINDLNAATGDIGALGKTGSDVETVVLTTGNTDGSATLDDYCVTATGPAGVAEKGTSAACTNTFTPAP